jgi:hypothetical protein
MLLFVKLSLAFFLPSDCPLWLQLHTYYKSHIGYYRLLPCCMSVFLLCMLMQECREFYKKYSSLLKHFPFPKHMSTEFLIFLQFQTFCKFIFYSSVIIEKLYLSGPVFSNNFYLMANFSHTVPCHLHLSQFSQYLQFTKQYLTHLFFWKEVNAIPLHFTVWNVF